MPPSKNSRLSDDQVKSIYLWILEGADNTVCNDSLTCDTTKYAFAADIMPIFSLNCVGCHNAGNANGGLTISGYDNLVALVNNGKIQNNVINYSGILCHHRVS